MINEIAKEEAPSPTAAVSPENHRFGALRSVQWRINLGILPSSSSADDLRKITADSRRRYAGLRRRLLVDPHIPKDAGSNSPDLVMDNPLSQNPDSTWGRFFRNAELEKMVDQDLSRLYPEHGSYFQTPGCQGMLRRILLLWCLRHPECGYRQGMHELLAPLLYVLHFDIECLSEVRKLYEDHFIDKFDGLSFEENDVACNFDFKKFLDSVEDDIGSQGDSKKVRRVEELDPEIQIIILLSDAYGAEGELGIVLSEKFMEHDAYCMFDALMSGASGAVAMAEFFAPAAVESYSGLPPVIEASAALYHLLSIVDSSLHSHLVDIGVEPQYFALRWFRVLFGREFSLQNLLVVWDEIFIADNRQLNKYSNDAESSSFKILNSHRGALISAIAVSMILCMRSALLATEHATSCLQRLLKFPENIDMKKLIAKAKTLQILALDSNVLSKFAGTYASGRSAVVRSQSLSSDPVSPKSPLSRVPDSYWEEKWTVLHKAEELRQDSLGKPSPSGKKRWSEKVKLSLSRTESDPLPTRAKNCKKSHRSTIRRSLLDDLSRQLGLEEDAENGCHLEASNSKDHDSVEIQMDDEDGINKESSCRAEERCEGGNGTVVGEENSSFYRNLSSPAKDIDDHENDVEKSSVASNSSIDENDDHQQTNEEEPALVVSLPPQDISLNSLYEKESSGKMVSDVKERKHLSGRFQWFWNFGRNNVSYETYDKGEGANADAKSPDPDGKSHAADTSTASASCNPSSTSKGDAVDQNVMSTLKHLGHSMLEQIQVIESVFQQDHHCGHVENVSKNNIVGKGQVTAMTALKELRKISNLLSEM